MGGVALLGAESPSWDLSNDDAQQNVIDLGLAPSSLPAPRALPDERVERIPKGSASQAVRRIPYFASSSGIPAEHGKDLLTFLEIRTT
jgi:hypothetical protein